MLVASVITAFALQATPASWVVNDVTSAVDGRRSFTAGVLSDADLVNAIGRPAKALVSVGCVNRDRVVALAWPTFLGRDEVQVTWRAGAGEPRRSTFAVLAPGTGAALYGREAERMLTAMEAGGTLAIRVEGYADTQEATFKLDGAAANVATVREACPRR